ncbi:DUF397 domain-containing protein [Streptomyces sp. NPDC000987]|uniref:DUF397 domain-containing protein n=1 Tax=Streptomyces sp. NPDC000987 TaxID=3154374 RepID=UPI003319422D
MNARRVAADARDLRWFKSSYSGAEGGDCVEVAASPSSIHVRDSEAVSDPALTMDRIAWAAFIGFAACQGSTG